MYRHVRRGFAQDDEGDCVRRFAKLTLHVIPSELRPECCRLRTTLRRSDEGIPGVALALRRVPA